MKTIADSKPILLEIFNKMKNTCSYFDEVFV